MKNAWLPWLALSILLVPGVPRAHEGDVPGGRLGKVSFPNSCSEKVKAKFERGVAMLHSFWYCLAEKTFDEILVEDPQCALAAK